MNVFFKFSEVALVSLLSLPTVVHGAPPWVHARVDIAKSFSDKMGSNGTAAIAMVHILMDPAIFSGREVEFLGYKKMGVRMVFLTEDHAKVGDTLSAFYFADSRPGFYGECEDSYVKIRGKVVRSESGFYSLAEVKSLQKYTGDECEANQVEGEEPLYKLK